MLVVELAGRKCYLRVNGVRNKVMSNVIRKQASGIQKQGKQDYLGPNVRTTFIYYVPVSSSITCLRLLTWKSRY